MPIRTGLLDGKDHLAACPRIDLHSARRSRPPARDTDGGPGNPIPPGPFSCPRHDTAVALDSFLWLAGIRQLPAIKSHRRASQRRLNNLSGRQHERRNGQSSPLLSGLIVRMV